MDIELKVVMRYRITLNPRGVTLLNDGAITPSDLLTAACHSDIGGDDHDTLWYNVDDLDDGTCLCHISGHDDADPEFATLIGTYACIADAHTVVA